MIISNDLMQAFLKRNGLKHLKIEFPEISLTLDESDCYEDSLKLKESILENSKLEFVGCFSSNLQLELHGITASLKGKHIIVSITMDGFETGANEEWIQLFDGYVDSVKTRIDDSWKSITCYDALYYAVSDKDVASWYQGLQFPITMKDMRDSFFTEIGITQAVEDLPNDAIEIEKIYDPKTLNAMDVLKNICQANAMFGIIGRDGLFHYRTFSQSSGGSALYPSIVTFPSASTYPGAGNEDDFGEQTENINLAQWYSDIEFEDFDTHQIGCVQIQDSEKQNEVVKFGSGSNTYIIQGNIWAYHNADMLQMAENIQKAVSSVVYRPFEADTIGIPWVEVGAKVTFTIMDYTTNPSGTIVTRDFYIMNRELSGIQQLEESFEAAGQEYQNVFVSDLNVSVDLIGSPEDSEQNDRLDELEDAMSDMDDRVTELEDSVYYKILSVDTIPPSPEENTLYCIQAELVTVR